LASWTAKIKNKALWLNFRRVRTSVAGAFVVLGLFLLGPAMIARAQNDGPDSSALTFTDERQALAKAKAQSILADERAAKLDARASVEKSEAEAAKSRAAAVAARIQAAEADISAAEARVTLIERMRADLRAKLAAEQEPAVRLMGALQTLSRRPPALALIQPGSIDDLVHVRAVLAGLLPQLRKKTAKLRMQIEKSKNLRADADRAIAALDTSKQRLAEKRGELLQLSAERRLAYDQLRGSALAEQDRAIALGEKARDIVELMDDLAEDGALNDRLAELPGPMLRPKRPGDAAVEPGTERGLAAGGLPYRLPVLGSVVTGLGEVSVTGVRSRGLTLAVRPLAQLVAPAAGRIVFAGPYRGYGKIVIIDHGQGWTSLITAISALDVAVGDSLLQGSPVGRAGPEAPTITVELRRRNVPVDITRFVG
jgi:murein hydrolase activator